MKNFLKFITLCILVGTLGGYAPAGAVDISQYTSFPAFLPRVVSPNILFLLDFSDEMVRPAYGQCNSLLSDCRTKYLVFDNYSADTNYYGYFDAPYKYQYGSGYYSKSATGIWGSNWLNWLTMTQFDVLKKVSVGGDIKPAPEQANPQDMDLKSRLTPAAGGTRTFVKVVDKETCLANAPPELCMADVPQEVPYQWVATPASGVTYLWKNLTVYDEDSKNIALPFPVKFYGTEFSRANVSDNGFVQLVNDTTVTGTYYTNYTMPYNDTVNNLLAIWWDDLGMRPLAVAESTANESSVGYFVKGEPGDRVLVITWSNIYPYYVTSIDRAVTFQMLIFERDGHIVYQYKDVAGGLGSFGDNNSDKAITATIGVENGDGSKGRLYSFNGTRPLRDGMALLMTPDYTVIQLTTQGTNNGTLLQPAAPIAAVTSGVGINTFEVYIKAKKADCTTSGYPYPYRDDSPNHSACYDHKLRGLTQELRDSEREGNLGFRLAIMKTNSRDNTGKTDGGKVTKHFNDKDSTGWPSLMNDIRSGTPTGGSPLAESLHVAHGYFRLDDSYKFNLTAANSFSNNSGWMSNCNTTGTNWDPYCFQSSGRHVECVKSYVLLVSSGHYTHDFTTNFDGTTNTENAAIISKAEAKKATPNADATILEQIAYKGRSSDNRPADGTAREISGNQNVYLYAVNTYGEGTGIGTTVMKRAAQYGGYRVSPGETTPPSNPVGYYQPDPDTNLEDKIREAVSDIMKNSASGTSVSVLSTSAGGEGALYQAYFYPARVETGSTDEIRWPGYLRAFFLDRQQNLRDDSSGGEPDAALVLDEDKRVQMFLGEDSAVRVRRLNNDGTVVAGDPVEGLTMDEVPSIWEGGELLAKRSDKNSRNIYVWLDADADGKVDNGDFSALGGEALRLSATADEPAETLIPYLRAQESQIVKRVAVLDANGNLTYDADGNIITEVVSSYVRSAKDEAKEILKYTLGHPVDGFRNRCIAIEDAVVEAGCPDGKRVWPMGDIIFSTPTLVSVPGERFHTIYSDATYRVFANTYKQRRSMIYVGANDGMLHAFNGGVYSAGSKTSNNVGSFADNANNAINGWGSAELGEELWSFVPHDNLPHLAWLACNGTVADPSACGSSDYTHVYYVDQRPKATDVRIFNDAATGVSGLVDGQSNVSHPHGWGTILIVSMRLGGGAIDVDLNGNSVIDGVEGKGEKGFRSAIYVFDVTDPEKKPRLLWRYFDPGLGFTTSYPAIVRINNGATSSDPGLGEWFMVVGSGPKNLTGEKEPNRDYNFVGAPLSTGDYGQPGRVFVFDLKTGQQRRSFTAVAASAIMGDPTVVDINLDFSADVVYVGGAVLGTAGRVFRIHTNGNIDPTAWTLSTLFDPTPGTTNSDPDNVAAGGAPFDMGPLLVGPSVSKDVAGRLWVFFGTGRLKSTKDITNDDQQRFYGLKDACALNLTDERCIGGTESEPFDATKHVLPAEQYAYKWAHLYNAGAVKVRSTTNLASPGEQVESSVLCGATAVCSFQEMLSAARSKVGWYIKLDKIAGVSSERALARSSVLGGLLMFTTYKPASDICSIFGESNLYALYYETGTSYIRPVLPGDDAVFTESGKEYIAGKMGIGAGMPTSVGIAIGETISGFVQKSTGEIIRIETQPGLGVRSGASSWRETTNSSSGTGIETIYKHIVK